MLFVSPESIALYRDSSITFDAPDNIPLPSDDVHILLEVPPEITECIDWSILLLEPPTIEAKSEQFILLTYPTDIVE